MTMSTVATSSSPTVRLLGSRVPYGVARRTIPGLRVLAYHEVRDADTFSEQMRVLRSDFEPLDATQVAAWSTEGQPLPDRAAWVTFDDGHPSVFEHAAQVLARYDISATAFVCSAMIGTHEPYWWQVLARAEGAGLLSGPLDDVRRELKSIADGERRSRIAQMRAQLAEREADQWSAQATFDHLQSWTAAGHTLGNHSHDHPMLDRCNDAEAIEQVRVADAWLCRHNPGGPRLFAYPNGNWTVEVETELRRLNYDVAVLFDHRLVGRPTNPLRTSRLRIDSDAPADRFRAVVSGLHSLAFHRLRRSKAGA